MRVRGGIRRIKGRGGRRREKEWMNREWRGGWK